MTKKPEPQTAQDLGAEPSRGGMALLIVDMISGWSFPDAEKLLPGAVRIAPRIAALKARCAKGAVPVIYANDNLGRWRSDLRKLVAMSLERGGDPAAVTTALRPADDDYFILKPKHSAFYATPLALLLKDLSVDHLIVAGVATDQCVMATVSDARMRDLAVTVPKDCVASQTDARNEVALEQFREVFKLGTPASARVRLVPPYIDASSISR